MGTTEIYPNTQNHILNNNNSNNNNDNNNKEEECLCFKITERYVSMPDF